MDKYNLYDHKSFTRVEKAMREIYPERIDDEPALNHGMHDNIREIHYAVNKDGGWPKDILLNEYEIRVRQELTRECLKYFNFKKELEILKFRQQVYKDLSNRYFKLTSKKTVISYYVEEERSFKEAFPEGEILQKICRLDGELRAILKMKGVSFVEEDRIMKERADIAEINRITASEYFNSEGFNGDW